jgi:hypothetical protein
MNILGKEYNLKFGLRSMFIFESITGNVFNIKSMFDEYIYFYSCIMADTNNPKLDFDDFINYCDEHPELLKEFDEALIQESKRKELLTNKDKKKAKTVKK